MFNYIFSVCLFYFSSCIYFTSCSYFSSCFDYSNNVLVLFLKATDNTKRRRRTITANLKKERSEKEGDLPHERFTLVRKYA